MHLGGVTSDIAGWYNSRSYIIAKNHKELLQLGIFNSVVEDMFEKASKRGILTQVSKMLELYLSQ